jgi:hypothetical protein
MTHSAEETATILISLYEESYAGENASPFRINWPELRSLAGIARLSDEFLWDLDLELKEFGYFLCPLDNFVLVALESDFSHIRAVPPRIIEQYLPDDEDDFDLLGFDDDDDDDDDDEFVDDQELATLFEETFPDVEPAPPEPKTAPTGKRGGGKKGKGSGKTADMAE